MRSTSRAVVASAPRKVVAPARFGGALRSGRLLLLAIATTLGACGRAAPPGPTAESTATATAEATATEGGPTAPSPPPAGEVGSPERGREIFLRGVSPSGGEFTCEVGMRGGAVVPAASLPCVNCHGRDGRGKPEGGVAPTNVRWESLTRPYAVTEARGRAHPPYDERLAGRAITLGVDPAGQRLDDAMPRYRLSRRDLADLLAYLKALSAERDPGIGDAEIRIGTLVPADGPLASSGAAVREALAAYFADVNERGGVYGRRIELAYGEIHTDAPGADRAKEVDRFLERARPFALVGVLLGADDEPVAALLEASEVPLIGAISLEARRLLPPRRCLFHLTAGLEEQALALATFQTSAEGGPRTTTAVIRGAGPGPQETARRVAQRLRGKGEEVPDIEIDPAGAAAAGREVASMLLRDKVGAVVLLGPPGGPTAVVDAWGRAGLRPLVLLPGAMAGPDLLSAPPEWADRLRIAFPVLPSDRTPEALSEHKDLARRHHLSADHAAAQLAAIAAAKVLIEGLTRGGHDATRDRLIDAVEGLRDFRTGLLPPLTFGKNRRVGAAGAHIVKLDPRTRRVVVVSPWVSSE